ncbi:MAG: arylsulfatase [Bacteroidetes bacterium]|nr:arylsulfatase [Bacteroidota bacterium]MDA1121898.1 arylsulfatase [Bacteroidota bacterium]
MKYAACLLGMFLLFSCTEEKQERKPNIIFILADDLGYGDLGCYGQKQILTPFLDQMAKEGILFTNHYAGSTVCAPSRSALITGKHTGQTRVRGNAKVPLLAEDTTVAELMKQAGYVTGMFGKWGLGEVTSTGQPNDQGFDEFVGYLSQVRAHNAYPEWIWQNKDTVKLDNVVKYVTETYAAGIGGIATEKNTHTQNIFTAKAIEFIEAKKDSAFFLYVPYTLPHANNEARHFDAIGMETPKLLGYDTIASWNDTEKAFASAVTCLDSDVGKILSKLKELNLNENTLVIFTSDNGPHHEGGHDDKFFNSSGLLRGTKRDVYDGGFREPFIARWPGKIQPGTTSDHTSAFWDFMPTACELAGVKPPSDINGKSYLNALLGKPQEKHDYLYWEFYEQGGKQAVRLDQWKGVRLGVQANPDAPIELYDVVADPGETNNVADQNPEVVRRINGIMVEAHVFSPDFNFEFENKAVQ